MPRRWPRPKAPLDLVMIQRAFGAAGDKVVVEEMLTGEEAAFWSSPTAETILPMPSTQDHKAVGDGDTGPNTGGMGAYSPAPIVTPELEKKIMEHGHGPCHRRHGQGGLSL